MNTCCVCPTEIDIDNDDWGWSATKEDYICVSCRDGDESSLSTIIVVPLNGKTIKYHIGDHTRISEFGDDMYGSGLTVDRVWVSSDAYRGHYNTTISGWDEVLVGWTTGAWGDDTSNRKQSFNEWADDICRGEIIAPVPLAIVLDPTSNVFSMGISVLTTEPDKFKEWANSDFGDLLDSLS